MKVYSICEIGVNHGGSYEKALRMVHLAKQAGATAVKLQKYNPIKVLGKDHPALNDAHQLSWKELTELSHESRKLGLQFGCSVFDVNDIVIVDRLVDFHKIASRMNRNTEFIAKIEATKKPTFMSIQPDTVDQRIPERFKLLWCIREYPSLKSEVLKYPYGQIGLSSHCPDPSATFEAVKSGAKWIENHVKEDDKDLGCDMSSSLPFKEYEKMLADIATVEVVRCGLHS